MSCDTCATVKRTSCSFPVLAWVARHRSSRGAALSRVSLVWVRKCLRSFVCMVPSGLTLTLLRSASNRSPFGSTRAPAQPLHSIPIGLARALASREAQLDQSQSDWCGFVGLSHLHTFLRPQQQTVCLVLPTQISFVSDTPYINHPSSIIPYASVKPYNSAHLRSNHPPSPPPPPPPHPSS